MRTVHLQVPSAHVVPQSLRMLNQRENIAKLNLKSELVENWLE